MATLLVSGTHAGHDFYAWHDAGALFADCSVFRGDGGTWHAAFRLGVIRPDAPELARRQRLDATMRAWIDGIKE